ncbi:hypothetical protein DIPPA_34272 [Diplonema papillatum]|nr:hypothetical protein DIPPA_34272 [Diplonema papillatum]
MQMTQVFVLLMACVVGLAMAESYCYDPATGRVVPVSECPDKCCVNDQCSTGCSSLAIGLIIVFIVIPILICISICACVYCCCIKSKTTVIHTVAQPAYQQLPQQQAYPQQGPSYPQGQPYPMQQQYPQAQPYTQPQPYQQAQPGAYPPPPNGAATKEAPVMPSAE